MKPMSANEAKKHFGELLDTARREPVTVEKHGRRVAVMMSAEDFDDIQQIKLERLRAEIDIGRQQLARGEGRLISSKDEMDELFEQIIQEGRKRLKNRAAG
jgi:prevent-host-death family protein